MGNKQSERLSEHEAWELATAWHPQIRDVMGLRGAFPWRSVGPSRDPFVEFVFQWLSPKKVEEAVLAARAATLVWFALSCCPGFSADENPDFWWHVLLARAPFKYAGPTNPATSLGVHVSSSHRFFPDGERPFPSVRIVPQQRVCPTLPLFLFGAKELTRPQTQAIQIEKTLTQAVNRLSPFISEAAWRRNLPVAVSSSDFSAVTEVLLGIPKRAVVNVRNPSSLKPLVISEVHTLGRMAARRDLTALLESDPNVKVMFSESLSVIYHSNRLNDAQGSRSRVRVETLELCSGLFVNDDAPMESVHATCSQLPHTDSIQSVNVTIPLEAARMAVEIAAWLGYAIFHPETTVDTPSSFTDLSLSLVNVSYSALSMLKLMAQGNNLLVAMGVTNAVSTSYQQVLLHVGARVWPTREQCDSTLQSEDREATVLLTADTPDAWLTVCLEEPREASLDTMDGPVRVVVPGVGIGWLHTRCLLEIRTLPPNASRVHRLCIWRRTSIFDIFYDRTADIEIVDVLEILGGQLSFLEIAGTGPMPAADLQRILYRCPNLKGLRVQHGGSCWSDASGLDLPELPRLESLELVVDGALRPLRAPQLASLRHLHVERASPGMFRSNRDALVPVLELYPDLQSIVWLAFPAAPVTYAEETQRLLDGIAQRGVHDVARVPLQEDARMAFLSVVPVYRTRHPLHPLGRVGMPEIARLIFNFSSSVVPRKFHINDRP